MVNYFHISEESEVDKMTRTMNLVYDAVLSAR